MHPRNRYLKGPADFGQLAEFRPSLKPHLIEKHGGGWKHVSSHAFTLDFSNPAALRELTCAVLEKDFDLRLEIPVDSLIPTVPQKLNYIHWVEDLLSCGGVACQGDGVVLVSQGEGVASQGESVASEKTRIPKGKDVVGIDIGWLCHTQFC